MSEIRFVSADLFQRDPLFVRNLDIQSESGCWIWNKYAYSGKKGTTIYGHGWWSRYKRTGLMHRYVWMLFWGKIPDDYEIHHMCRTGLCCNPNHMQCVSPEEHDRIHGGRDNRLRKIKKR